MRWAGLKGHNWANKQPKLIVKKKNNQNWAEVGTEQSRVI
jgi:hypothetical protein